MSAPVSAPAADEFAEFRKLVHVAKAWNQEQAMAMVEDLASLLAAADRVKELEAEVERLTIRGAAYEEAFGVAHRATYQSHNGHWDSTMQGGLGCRECIRAKEAREECDGILRRGLEQLARAADGRASGAST